MAFLKLFIVIPSLFFMVLAKTQLAQCNTLKAKISCLDCPSNYDFSGNRIVVKCDDKRVKNGSVVVAISKGDGSFETRLPFSDMNCLARLVGGPKQLYASKKDMVSTVIIISSTKFFFTIATPLKFSTSSSKKQQHQLINNIAADSSKTIIIDDFPNFPPADWGFPPSTYYLLPFLPIIGIP